MNSNYVSPMFADYKIKKPKISFPVYLYIGKDKKPIKINTDALLFFTSERYDYYIKNEECNFIFSYNFIKVEFKELFFFLQKRKITYVYMHWIENQKKLMSIMPVSEFSLINEINKYSK